MNAHAGFTCRLVPLLLLILFAMPFASANDSSTNTIIHNENHSEITQAESGQIVHPFARITVTTPPIAAGTVTFSKWDNNACAGTPASTSAPFPVVQETANTATADGVTFTFPANGLSFQATYSGGGTHPASVGDCQSVLILTTGQTLQAGLLLALALVAILFWFLGSRSFVWSIWAYLIVGIVLIFAAIQAFDLFSSLVLSTILMMMAIMAFAQFLFKNIEGIE